MEEKPRTLIDKLVDLDMRYVFLLVFLALGIPLLRPLGLPIEIGENSKTTFEIVEALPEGANVVYAWDASSGTWMDQGPGATVLLKHLFKTPGIKIIGWCFTADGPMFWEQVTKDMNKHGKIYGEDYVWLGFIPGGESAAASVAQDTWAAYSNTDDYGNKFEDLPIMENFEGAGTTDLLIDLCSGTATPLPLLRQWVTPFDVPFICVPLGSVATNLEPYRESGQIKSWIASTREAAEYELLIDEPGAIIATMDAQSVGHILVLILLIFGNIVYFIKKSQGG
jgi:hypothetical protein